MDVNESQVPRVEVLMQVRYIVPQNFFLKKIGGKSIFRPLIIFLEPCQLNDNFHNFHS